jgi:type I restriction enzyme S subunit
MPSEWKPTIIDELKDAASGSIAIGPFGSRMKSDCYVSSGVRVIRGTNLMGSKAFAGDFVYISPEKAASLGAANLKSGDLVFPHRGAIGEVGLVPNDGERYILSTSLMKLSSDINRARPEFLYYFFKSPQGKHALLQNASQVGTPGIGQPLTSLRNISLLLPDTSDQDAIVELLSSLDERMISLAKCNEMLEAMARAIFKSWFVDFDPVRAKAAGRELEGMDGATAALFPDGFNESDHGLIPHGWKYTRVSDLIEQSRESVNPLRCPKERFAHFSLPAFDEGKRPKLEYGEDIKSNKTALAPGCILLSKLNPHIPRIWLPNLKNDLRAICSTEFLVLLPANGFSAEYFFCQFSETGFAQQFGGLTTGTSNSHQRVKVDHLMEQRLLEPDHPIVEAFTVITRPLFNKAKANIELEQTFAELRDTLLPRLISGKLRVSEAEKMAEAVL